MTLGQYLQWFMEIMADEGGEKTNPNKANFQRNDEDRIGLCLIKKNFPGENGVFC